MPEPARIADARLVSHVLDELEVPNRGAVSVARHLDRAQREAGAGLLHADLRVGLREPHGTHRRALRFVESAEVAERDRVSPENPGQVRCRARLLGAPQRLLAEGARRPEIARRDLQLAQPAQHGGNDREVPSLGPLVQPPKYLAALVDAPRHREEPADQVIGPGCRTHRWEGRRIVVRRVGQQVQVDAETGMELRLDEAGADVEVGDRVGVSDLGHRAHRPSGGVELQRRVVVGDPGKMLEDGRLQGGIVGRLDDSLLAVLDGASYIEW